MKYYLITHTHKHGTDHHFVKSKKNLSEFPDKQIYDLVGLNYEEELNEDIIYFQISFEDIPELK